MGSILDIVWILVLLQLFVPVLQRSLQTTRRRTMMRRIERARGSRLITIIHRQETMSLLGFPIARYIDIEDSEQVLRAIRLTPDDMPVDVVLHTPGGLVIAAEQIAEALKRHKGRVTVFVPHYAMSGGTLIALGADEIVMDPDAVLGPVDPQIGGPGGATYPAASILKALEEPNPNRDDETLILGDLARKALQQVYTTTYNLLAKHMPPEQADRTARALSSGQWTHDYPIDVQQARELGLPVSDQMPPEIYALMELYPQTSQRRPSVEYVPVPYEPVLPRRRDRNGRGA
ncbi:MAG: hypothetical protein QJR03_10640 [Sphaerobacter sp.]|nr:hypothetical protein [Sphaerobacter sp.]